MGVCNNLDRCGENAPYAPVLTAATLFAIFDSIQSAVDVPALERVRETPAPASCSPSQVPKAVPLPSRSANKIKPVNAVMIKGYRTARAWMLPRIDTLRAAGWTRDRLFQIKHPFGHPYTFGLAWSPWWTSPGMIPNVGSAGEIEFNFTGGSVLRARP